MNINFDASKPIYEQIIDQIKQMLVRGELNPGDKLPSQRDMAKKIEVNPNTIQRAYREMETLELVETQRGRGTFIKEDKNMVLEIKKEMARNATFRFLQEMTAIGFSTEEIINLVEKGLINFKVNKEN
ncbi:GntR family transcriptional regulator [Iocasia frigidifontis]|uniref:GntR family transcriptional regulator n=1 Tax=Iocasia fonsfrigidae TaxID=2682810 RepID=A0A8A7KD20_9FIRM|nr:GntR family transcriptional regulator [Iocasia fonsfrigidae]QTL97508.1 GntR family transcriptional regulator [Iocasia fonsfrigidae]